MRLDVYLKETGLVKSRSMAAQCIKAGLVSVDGRTDRRASFELSGSETVTLTGLVHDYVGRGGVKLEFALDCFGINVADMRAVDIGASTGGFTDCLLRRGAAAVCAVDSGHGQLDPRIASDPRVRSLEGFNARFLTSKDVGYSADIAVLDVSFISQTLILPQIGEILVPDGIYVGLVKPQFELDRSALSHGGIVRDPKSHALAVMRVAKCAVDSGLSVCGVAASPVTGGDGNREFLIYLKNSTDGNVSRESFESTVKEVCRC